MARATITISNITTTSAQINIRKNDATQIHVVVREKYGDETIIFDTGIVSIVQSTATTTITGLSPSTTYAYNLWDDVDGWGSTRSFTTKSETPSPPSSSPSVNIESVLPTSVYFSWNTVSRATGYDIYIGTSTSFYAQNWISGTSYTETDLSPNTVYRVAVRGVNSGGEGPWGSQTFQTGPTSGSGLNATAKGSKVTVTFNSIPGATQYQVIYRKANESSAIETDWSSSKTVTLYLEENETYIINYRGRLYDSYQNEYRIGSLTTSITVETSNNRPDDWIWTTSFYKGKKLPVHPTNHTYEILPATEWTAFQNRINEFREYTGLPEFGFTNVSRGTHFDNTIWNEAVYAICNMTDNSYQNIKKFEANDGSIINDSSKFQKLADELNSIT